MRAALFLGICLALTITSLGCGTIKGIGKDITTVGGWVTSGSDRVKEGR